MRIVKIIACSFLSTGLLFACSDKNDFLADNTNTTGVGSIPVSNNTLQDVTASPIKNLGTSSGSATAYPAGSTFKTELTYFSQSPVKEINFYATVGAGTKTLVSNFPYSPAFSTNKRLDTLLVPYTLPAGSAGTVIKLEYQILNENTLSINRTAYVKIQ